MSIGAVIEEQRRCTGVVVIGRNEGERLERCLRAVADQVRWVVYADSGSTDQSVSCARARGVEVVELDGSKPYTAGRARNAGFVRLMELDDSIAWVQFVDGDCEIVDGWLEAALRKGLESDVIAVVSGRRRERHPDRSPYNRLCDLEWNSPLGESGACHGDAMIRVQSFRAVGGFVPSLIAGEEPELCVRLRHKGWKIWRIDQEMTRHDAGMTRFGQWWRRAVRAGHAYAEGARRHGRSPMRHNIAEVRSILCWGIGVPALAALGLIGAWAWSSWALGLTGLAAAGYAALMGRVYEYRVRRGDPRQHARLYAFFCVLGKLPNAQGALIYWLNRLRHKQSQLIEYKDPETKAKDTESVSV